MYIATFLVIVQKSLSMIFIRKLLHIFFAFISQLPQNQETLKTTLSQNALHEDFNKTIEIPHCTGFSRLTTV